MRARNISLWTMMGAGVLGCFAALALALPSTGQDCPLNPPVTLSPDVPQDVCIPLGFTKNAIKYFDDYSWRSFAALVWPARDGSRGLPDPSQTIGGKGPRVFETYKAIWEVFHNDPSAPAAWNEYDDRNACSVKPEFGEIVLASYSKYSDLGQADIGKLVGPLVAQNGTYVRFLTGMNKLEFDQIASAKLYLRANLTQPITFKNGALDVKSAWIDMKGVPNPERYYTKRALVRDPLSGKCSLKDMGLVGLHIVQKTPSRPQWIWSTFEHVDNVPGQRGAHGTFNDGSGTPMPDKNPNKLEDVTTKPTPPPFNVDRVKPIHASTQKTNDQYRQELSRQGSVWQYYQLVMTQWPNQPNRPDLPGTPENTFPGSGEDPDDKTTPNDATSFANVTMETFDQKAIRTGCMNCHNYANSGKEGTDYLWVLRNHAWPSQVPNARRNDTALRALEALLKHEEPEPTPQPKRKPEQR